MAEQGSNDEYDEDMSAPRTEAPTTEKKDQYMTTRSKTLDDRTRVAELERQLKMISDYNVQKITEVTKQKELSRSLAEEIDGLKQQREESEREHLNETSSIRQELAEAMSLIRKLQEAGRTSAKANPEQQPRPTRDETSQYAEYAQPIATSTPYQPAPKRTNRSSELFEPHSDIGLIRRAKAVTSTFESTGSRDSVCSQYALYRRQVITVLRFNRYTEPVDEHMSREQDDALLQVLQATTKGAPKQKVLTARNAEGEVTGYRSLMALDKAYRLKPTLKNFSRLGTQLRDMRRKQQESVDDFEARVRDKVNSLNDVAKQLDMNQQEPAVVAEILQSAVLKDKKYAGLRPLFLIQPEQDEDPIEQVFSLLRRWEEDEVINDGSDDDATEHKSPDIGFPAITPDQLPARRNTPQHRGSDYSRQRRPLRGSCFRCGANDHYRRQCKNNPTDAEAEKGRAALEDYRLHRKSYRPATDRKDKLATIVEETARQQVALMMVQRDAAISEKQHEATAFMALMASAQVDDLRNCPPCENDRFVLVDNGASKNYCGAGVPLQNERPVTERTPVITAGGVKRLSTCGELTLWVESTTGEEIGVQFTVHRLHALPRDYLIISEHILDEMKGSKMDKYRSAEETVLGLIWTIRGLQVLARKNLVAKYFYFSPTRAYNVMATETAAPVMTAASTETSTTPTGRSILRNPVTAIKRLDTVLGFPSERLLRQTALQMKATGQRGFEKVRITKEMKTTEPYVASRQTKKPVRSKKTGGMNMVQAMQREYGHINIIFCDLFEPTGLNAQGFKFSAIFIDGDTKYAIAIPLVNKSAKEVTQALRDFVITMQTAPICTKRYLETETLFHSDQGSAFISRQFKEQLAEYGMKQTFSPAGAHTKNAVCERRIAVVTGIARSLLLYANLDTSLWIHAWRWACFLSNLWPQAQNVSPYERLSGRTPCELINKLLPFGQPCYFLNSHAQGRHVNKLTARGLPGLVMGYSEKTRCHLVYNIATKRVTTTLEVRLIPLPSADRWKQIPRLPQAKVVLYSANIVLDLSMMITEHAGREDSIALMLQTQTNALDKTSVEDGDTALLLTEKLNYYQVVKMENGELKNQMLQAYNEELEQMETKEVWRAVKRKDIPPAKKILPVVCTIGVKHKADGTIDKIKARVCANGAPQEADRDDTYAATTASWVVITMIALAATFDQQLFSLDVKGAFLNAQIGERKEYMAIPPGYGPRVDAEGDELALELLKSIYGLKTSGRRWSDTLSETLNTLGFKRLLSDRTVFVCNSQKETGSEIHHYIVLCVYVDDMLGIANTVAAREWFIRQFQTKFASTVEREPTGFLGLRISRTATSIKVDQEAYIKRMINVYNLEETNDKATPMITRSNKEAKPLNDKEKHLYMSLVGALRYALRTRLSLQFPVNALSRKLQCPDHNDLAAALRLAKYMKKTKEYALEFPILKPEEQLDTLRRGIITAYSDASLADDKSNYRSTLGTVVCFAGRVIRTSSNTSQVVASSSCYAEYQALASCVKRVDGIRNLLTEMKYPLGHGYNSKDACSKIAIGIDNQAAKTIATEPITTEKSRHFCIRYHLVREACVQQRIGVDKVPGKEIVADGCTKALGAIAFGRHDDLIRHGRNDLTSLEKALPSMNLAPSDNGVNVEAKNDPPPPINCEPTINDASMNVVEQHPKEKEDLCHVAN